MYYIFDWIIVEINSLQAYEIRESKKLLLLLYQ